MTAVAEWYASLSDDDCRELNADYNRGSRDPAAIDGHDEAVRRGLVLGRAWTHHEATS